MSFPPVVVSDISSSREEDWSKCAARVNVDDLTSVAALLHRPRRHTRISTMTMTSCAKRRYAVGPELVERDRVHLRVWAPDHQELFAVVEDVLSPMHRERDGHFSVEVTAHPGSRYGFRVAGDDHIYPDPASRWLPDGPDGLSAIVDLDEYAWHDHAWRGASLSGQVLYELHIGTCTLDGTWCAAERLLPDLRALGVTVIQMMPVAEFAGRFGWGYDAVQWFAPMHAYGTPTDLQHFIDVAHEHGLGVLLDVVYNHLGPSGNVLEIYDRRWRSQRHTGEWGSTLNFDGEGSSGMRALVLDNVQYWIREFHLDGFRIDAAQQIIDESPEHLLAVLSRTTRDAARGRWTIVVAEHEAQDARLMRPAEAGGYGLNGVFNEDFHHSCRVALTGNRDAYLTDYDGTSREWLSAALWGFLYQGQFYSWQDGPRGTPAIDCAPFQFVTFLENHDQVANSADGRRLIDLTSESCWRAMSALLLLGPWTPLIFQGQEDGVSTPFLYFCDHHPELQAAVEAGRRTFLAQFSRRASLEQSPCWHERVGAGAFLDSKLDRTLPRVGRCRQLYTDLLTLRRDDPTIARPHSRLAGTPLGERTLLLRYLGSSSREDRLVAVNLGADVDACRQSNPLVAPPTGHGWRVRWCSEDPRYGGSGTRGGLNGMQLMLTGHATTVFEPNA